MGSFVQMTRAATRDVAAAFVWLTKEPTFDVATDEVRDLEWTADEGERLEFTDEAAGTWARLIDGASVVSLPYVGVAARHEDAAARARKEHGDAIRKARASSAVPMELLADVDVESDRPGRSER